ncbi:translation initiation factor IF-2-like [Sturnira hondurensis]|uniref:translation initiation factor IF-2-like n=1 Tax=Sturnira hondurensis TaxID=192404 RepID=UPI00187AB675|nr:translation initiation factor IF-2-like [Sturnira hondurensis]
MDATGPPLLLLPGMGGSEWRLERGGATLRPRQEVEGRALKRLLGECRRAEGSCRPRSRRGPAGVKTGAVEDGGGDEEGEGQAKRSRDPPSPLPPSQAPGAAYGHPCPYKGGCRRGNERPPPVRGALPCPRPRPPPAPRMERCVSNRPQREAGARGRQRRQRQRERGSGPGSGPGLACAAAAGTAVRKAPASGPAGPERPPGGLGDPGGAATGPGARPPPLPLAAGSRATCG